MHAAPPPPHAPVPGPLRSGLTTRALLTQALAAMLCLATLFLACGCASGRQQAAQLAETRGFKAQRFDTQPFVLQGWLKPGRGTTLSVYIEGDGMAWIRSNRPSSDPTPTNPVAFRLALSDPFDGPVLYLARPCQYTEDADRRGCTVEDWTSARFSERAVVALDQAISQAKALARAETVCLYGYSGGGGMAALLAARRNDVVFLGTIAGNLDHRLWTSLNDMSPLSGSLNPVESAAKTRSIPQLHVIGGKDEVITKAILDSWCKGQGWTQLTRITLPDASHAGPWEALWPDLLRRSRKP